MFLVYVDESGQPSNPEEKVFVLGAVAVYENQAYFLSQELDKVEEKWFPQAPNPIEFHASRILNGNEEPWHSTSKEDRKKILVDLCNAVVRVTPKGLSLFGIAVSKESFSNEDVVEKAFQELCGHIDAFVDGSNIERARQGREKNRALMILDSSKYGTQLDELLLAYRIEGGTKFGRVKNFADAPAFANSTTTRLLQVADLVSYAIHRRYEKADTSLLDLLLPRFQEKEGKIHGLMHLIGNWRSCVCPACISRRTASTV
jgi:hypothetical protein